MAEGSELVSFTNISRTFYTEDVETSALDNVDIKINKGEFVMLSGPSGCGKTTLLSIMGLIDSKFSGTYEFDGADISRLSSKERAMLRNKEIGFIFQSFNLIDDISVAENVELPLTYRKEYSSTQKDQLVESALSSLGIDHRAKHFPHQLSGGQQQRVAVARAIVGGPKLLLADEPTGNLDSTHGEDVMDLLSELHKGGSSIFMVTHDPRYSERAERSIAILDGKIIN